MMTLRIEMAKIKKKKTSNKKQRMRCRWTYERAGRVQKCRLRETISQKTRMVPVSQKTRMVPVPSNGTFITDEHVKCARCVFAPFLQRGQQNRGGRYISTRTSTSGDRFV